MFRDYSSLLSSSSSHAVPCRLFNTGLVLDQKVCGNIFQHKVILSYHGPFPRDAADVISLVKQRLVWCWEQWVFKQTSILLAAPLQSRERLAFVWSDHPPAHARSLLLIMGVLCSILMEINEKKRNMQKQPHTIYFMWHIDHMSKWQPMGHIQPTTSFNLVRSKTIVKF